MKLIQELLNFDTASISDVLDSYGIEGALLGLKPITNGKKIAGPAFTVKYSLYTNKLTEFKGAADYIDTVPENSIIIIDNGGRVDCTTWGSILTQVAMIKNISGTIVNGAIRDAEFIRESGYPVYAKDIYMRSGKNRVYKLEQQKSLTINNVLINPEDIIYGDDNGVIVIPKRLLKEVVLKVKNVDRTEKNIIVAVKKGLSLKDARVKYHYDTPWILED